MSKQTWTRPEAVRVSIKGATRGGSSTGPDSCGEGFSVNAPCSGS